MPAQPAGMPAGMPEACLQAAGMAAGMNRASHRAAGAAVTAVAKEREENTCDGVGDEHRRVSEREQRAAKMSAGRTRGRWVGGRQDVGQPSLVNIILSEGL